MPTSGKTVRAATPVSLRFYKDIQGKSPFQQWHDNLNAQAVDIVDDAIEKRKNGNTSSSKPVGEGVHELRPDKYRIYYANDGNKLIVLLGGGTKQRQQKDIDAAKTCWQDYQNRKKQSLSKKQSATTKNGNRPSKRTIRKAKQRTRKKP